MNRGDRRRETMIARGQVCAGALPALVAADVFTTDVWTARGLATEDQKL